MAFTLQNFQFGRGVTSSYTQGQGLTTVTHTYKSTDTLATINTSGYFPVGFDGDGDKVFVDDLLGITASDGTTLVRIDSLDPFTYGADLYSASGSSIVVGAPVAGSTGNGANISGTTLHMEYANASNPGILSTGAQLIGGSKEFIASIISDGGIVFGASPSVLSNYEEATHSTTFFNNTITTTAISITLIRIGKIVNVRIGTENTSGAQASPASSFTATSAVPAQFRPASGDFSTYWPVNINGTEARGEFYIDNTGVIQIFADVDNSAPFGNTSNIIETSAVTYNIL